MHFVSYTVVTAIPVHIHCSALAVLRSLEAGAATPPAWAGCGVVLIE